MKLSLLDRILNRCVLGVTSYNNTRCWISTCKHGARQPFAP